MAKDYLNKLSTLINETNIENECDFEIETQHFFSGAALYKNKTMCASLSPVGLAFKGRGKNKSSRSFWPRRVEIVRIQPMLDARENPPLPKANAQENQV